MYDIVKYWSSRENPNQDGIEIDTPVHLAFLRKHIKKGFSVLDFGPGTGRLFEAYSDTSYVEGYDITNIHRSNLLNISKACHINFKLIVSDKVRILPYVDQQFDASVAAEILLHQKPSDIEFVMSELVRVSYKVIVITWMENGRFFDYEVKDSNQHCFHHDYFKICAKNNWTILDFVKYKKQGMFVYKGE